MQEFCMVGGYTEDLTNHRTVKIGGWAIARGWALARDNMVVTVCLGYSQFCTAELGLGLGWGYSVFSLRLTHIYNTSVRLINSYNNIHYRL